MYIDDEILASGHKQLVWILPYNPLLYKILAGQSSTCKLGGREVKTSALVNRRSWVSIPPESPVDFFHRHLESTEYTVFHTYIGGGAKSNQFIFKMLKSYFVTVFTKRHNMSKGVIEIYILHCA